MAVPVLAATDARHLFEWYRQRPRGQLAL